MSLVCLCCGDSEGVQLEDSRTCYHVETPRLGRYGRLGLDDPLNDDPPPPSDPNAPIPLCRGCAKDHHDYWDERWAEYYAGLL